MTEQRSLIPAQRMSEFTGVTHKGMDDGCAIQKQLHLPKPHLSPGEVLEQLPHYSSFMSDSVDQRVSLQQLFIACVILRSLMNPKSRFLRFMLCLFLSFRSHPTPCWRNASTRKQCYTAIVSALMASLVTQFFIEKLKFQFQDLERIYHGRKSYLQR